MGDTNIRIEDRIVAAFVWWLAAWTLAVQLGTCLGMSFTALLHWTPLVLLIAATGWFACGTRLQIRLCLKTHPSHPKPVSEVLRRAGFFRQTIRLFGVPQRPAWSFQSEPDSTVQPNSRPSPIPWLIAAALATFTWRLGHLAFWFTSIFVLLAAWAHLTITKVESVVSTTRTTLKHAIGLTALCIAGVLITLFLHRPDIDDAFYISVAVDAHQHPHRALWSVDTVHDDPTLPVYLPIYKTEANEYLVALVAKLLHISSIRAAHTALPMAYAVLVVLAWAMLARSIDPKNWLLIASVAIVISLLAGEVHAGPGNFAFVRLHQGKAVMVSALVPILCVYAFRFITFGGWRNASMLAASMVASVGLSSTAILIAPAVVLAIGFCCAPPNRTAIARLAVIGLTCVYPMLLALLMHRQMAAITWIAQTPYKTFNDVIEVGLAKSQAMFFFAALLGAWAVSPRSAGKLLLAPGLLLLGVMLNPALIKPLEIKAFSAATFWRVLWVVPWPVWAAALVVGIGRLRYVGPPLAFLLLISLGVHHAVWRADNGTQIKFAALNVDQPQFTVAKRVAAMTPRRHGALAPDLVACWTAVQDNRPPLVYVRTYYTQGPDGPMRDRLGQIAGESAIPADHLATLIAGITKFRLGTIVLRNDAGPQAESALQQAGFHSEPANQYTIWTLPG